MSAGPPRLARLLLRAVVPAADRKRVDTEMEELRRLRVQRDGRRSADRWYRRSALGFALRAWGVRDAGHRPAAAVRAAGQDLRHAWRQCARRPGASVLAVAVLGLGVAAGTAVFTVVDAVVLRDLPYERPGELVHVGEVRRSSGATTPVAPPAFFLWSEEAGATLEGVAAVSVGGMDLEGVGEPEHVEVAAVTRELFDLLGVVPVLGRGFAPTEDAAGGGGVVVLSHGLWTRRFGGDDGAVGRSVRLGGERRTVVGVMPPGFAYPEGAEAWVPGRPELATMADVWGALFLDVVGRLRPAADPEAARAELDRILGSRPEGADWGAVVTPLRDVLLGDVRRPLFVLLGAVTLLLLAACANVGGLLLARALDRSGELAIRMALGAGRGRVVSVLVAEGLLLAGAAGLLGVLAARGGLAWLVALAPGDLPRAGEIALDGRVVLVALAATLLAGLVVGLVPGLRVRPDVSAALGERAGRGGPPAASRIRTGLAAAQVALTVVLLAGAGLLGRSFLDLTSRPRGFDPSGIATADLSLPAHRYADLEELRTAYRDLVASARTVPGARGAALTRNLPLGGRRISAPVEVEGRDGARSSAAHVSAVTPGYFDLLRIPVVRGRTLEESDVEGPPVAVVNEAFARAFLDGGPALGRRVRTYFDPVPMEVVGVVGDVRHTSLAEDPPPVLYRPLGDRVERGVHLVVGSDAPAGIVLPALREAVARARPDQPIRQLATMDALLARSVADTRFQALLLGAFALAGLALSGLGLYALLAGLIQRLRPEIGVRLALGASRRRVAGLVAERAAVTAGAGLVAGLPIALLLGRVLERLLHGVGPADAWALAIALGLPAVVAAVAAWPGIRRAVRIDPADALGR